MTTITTRIGELFEAGLFFAVAAVCVAPIVSLMA
jgi:hypothetical protein